MLIFALEINLLKKGKVVYFHYQVRKKRKEIEPGRQKLTERIILSLIHGERRSVPPRERERKKEGMATEEIERSSSEK